MSKVSLKNMLFEHVLLKVACNVILEVALDAIELEHRKEMSAVVQIAMLSTSGASCPKSRCITQHH